MQSIGKLVASQAAYYTEQLRHSVGEDVPVLRGERMPAQVDYYAGARVAIAVDGIRVWGGSGWRPAGRWTPRCSPS